jgi:2-haloalkanoic acid dehalogenase type II
MYSHYIKAALDNNEIVIVLPFYETVDSVRQVLSEDSACIDTLVDLKSVSKIFSMIDIKINNLKLFTEMWHSKQLQYAWLMNFTNRYEPFSELSLHALKYVARLFGLNLNDEQMSELSKAKLNLNPFPDSKKGLEKLNEAKRRKTIAGTAGEVPTGFILLSNGEAHKSDIILSNIKLRKYFDYIVSAEEVRKYKPSPEPYLLVSKKLNLHISQIALVSSNFWDSILPGSTAITDCMLVLLVDFKTSLICNY